MPCVLDKFLLTNAMMEKKANTRKDDVDKCLGQVLAYKRKDGKESIYEQGQR